MQTTGTYSEHGGQPVVRFERTVPHPVDLVWEAVTDPTQLGEWFPTTVHFERLEPGAAIEFEFEQADYPPMSGQVLEVQPGRRLSFTWGSDQLTFELESRDQGAACRLVLSVALDSSDKAARDSAGWEQCLDMLAVTLAGGIPERLPEGIPERPTTGGSWRAYYEEYKRLGLPARAPLPE
jgi:uncharacterized protein YndB with AHSA1/START domain